MFCKTKHLSSRMGLITPMPDKETDYQPRYKRIRLERRNICISIMQNYCCTKRSVLLKKLNMYVPNQFLNVHFNPEFSFAQKKVARKKQKSSTYKAQ